MPELMPNHVKQRWLQKLPSFGSYVSFTGPQVIEVAGLAGLHFARIDAYHQPFNPETMNAMVQTAYSYGVVPWMRLRNDPWIIMTALDLGVQMLTIPNTGSAAEARAAVEAAFYPPMGKREMGRPVRARGTDTEEYLAWAAENVVVSCQIEGAGGLENYQEIVKVEGVGCIQSGRGDISLALGVPGQEYHQTVLDAERRIVDAALEAGKQVNLVHPVTPDGLERIARWIEYGVYTHTLSSDYRVLRSGYEVAMQEVLGKMAESGTAGR